MMYSADSLLDYAQFFLLAMLVVGAAVKFTGDSFEKDSEPSFGGAAITFLITMIAWIILTVFTILALGLLAYGALMAWAYFANR